MNVETFGIELPSAIEVTGVAALPHTLENDVVSFEFESEPDYGVVLSRIEARDRTAPFSFITTSSGTSRNLGLWELHTSFPSTEGTVSVTPADAASGLEALQVSSAGGEQGLLLIWRGIRARVLVEQQPQPLEHEWATRLFVAQLITLGPNDSEARWRTWVGRERPIEVSVEAVDSPSIHLRGPVAPRPGESHLAAQRRSRLLIPTAANFVLQMNDPVTGGQAPTSLLNGVNWPLYYWSAFDVKNVFPQPNHQQQQFQAVYAADSLDSPSFRRLMYFATEDRTGYFKRFHHEGYSVEEKDGPSAWYNWRAQYVPGYEDALSDATEKPQTRFGNTFVTPYDAVVGPRLAKTDEFWFDVAEKYRIPFGDGVMWPTRTVDDPDRGALTHGAPLVGCIDQRNSARSTGRELFEDCFHAVRTVRKGLDLHGERTPLMFAHFQNLRADGFHVEAADLPLSENVDQALSPLVKNAALEGISTSFYVRPYDVSLVFTPNLAEILPPQARAYGPDGELAPTVVFLPDSITTSKMLISYVLDYGSPTAQTFFIDQIYGPLMREFGMRGAYTDVFAGIGSLIFYDPPPPQEPSHTAHGGDYYMRGKRALVTAIRAFMQDLATKREEDPQRYMIGGEGAEEFMADRYDWANAGYSYFGNHLMFAEDVALRWLQEYTGEAVPDGAFDGVPAASRNMTPPLWNLVHHEWAPGQRTVVPWNNIGLATNPHYYPADHHDSQAAPYSGIPPEKFVDLYAFTLALLINEGVRSSQFIYRRDVDDMLGDVSTGLWVLDDAGNPMVDPHLDPQGAGLKLRGFYEMLHREMHAGPAREFVLYGRMERSLQIDYGVGDVELRTNPMFWMFGQDSPAEFDPTNRFILYGRYVDPGPWPEEIPENRRPLLSVSPYPSAAFIGTTYLTGFLRFDSPAVVSSVWSDQSNRLGIVLVNWTGSVASFNGTMQVAHYGIDAKLGYDLRVHRNGDSLGGSCRFHSTSLHLSTLESGPNTALMEGLPPRSLTLVVLSYTKASS